MITGSNYETRSTVIFEKLGWEKIEIILKKREHIMTFKALRGETPNYLSDSGVARPSFLGGRSERQCRPKNFSRNNLFFTPPPPPPRRQKSFGQCTILGVQNFFRTSQCHCDQKYEIAFPHSKNCVAFSYDTE